MRRIAYIEIVLLLLAQNLLLCAHTYAACIAVIIANVLLLLKKQHYHSLKLTIKTFSFFLILQVLTYYAAAFGKYEHLTLFNLLSAFNYVLYDEYLASFASLKPLYEFYFFALFCAFLFCVLFIFLKDTFMILKMTAEFKFYAITSFIIFIPSLWLVTLSLWRHVYNK